MLSKYSSCQRITVYNKKRLCSPKREHRRFYMKGCLNIFLFVKYEVFFFAIGSSCGQFLFYDKVQDLSGNVDLFDDLFSFNKAPDAVDPAHRRESFFL